MVTYMADNTLEIDAQARAVLALLSAEEITHHSAELFWTKTAAWYNGRERGISIGVFDFKGPDLHVVVCNHRNSDQLVVYRWLSDHTYLNPPTPECKEFTDDVYHAGKYFDSVDDTYKYARSVIQTFVNGDYR